MREVDGEAGRGVSRQHLVRPVEPELTIGGGCAVKHFQCLGEVEPELLRQRQRLGIELT
jgi:hypothetical protein